MRAVAIDAFGGPEVLKVRDMPEPRAGDDDLLVEVHAAALNPVDTKIRRSGLGKGREFPLVLGYDVSGVVRQAGRNVQGFRVGDEVFASPSLIRNGSNAELVAIDYRTAARKPQTLSHEEAAAMPLVTLTAYEALDKRCQMHRGETVLIQGAAGGVGHIAVQLAKNSGCRVLATAGRPETIEFVRRLGADLVIDYRKEDVAQRIRQETRDRGCDVVFDTVGEDVFVASIDCVGVNGRLVTILAPPANAPIGKLYRLNATVHMEFMPAPTMYNVHPESQGQILQLAAEFVEAGKLRPHVSKVISLEELAEGHRMQESQRTIGKIVIKVK